ncbi:MAG TPA: hypothetical protein PLM85_09565 [Nitrosomonas sp.]|nr:hypothetical protein [Nitrosomonas sp.]HNJ38553.1 hypothetical protein [Nitrosomonas sp.]
MAGQLILLVNQPNSDKQITEQSGVINSADAPKSFGDQFKVYLNGLLGGAYSGQIIGRVATAAASQTVTLTYANIVNGTDILSIGGKAFAAKASPAADGEWAKGANLAASVNNLVAAINNYTATQGILSASGNTSTGVITISCVQYGLIGNLIPVTVTAGTGIVAGGAYLAGGTNYVGPKTYKFGY